MLGTEYFKIVLSLNLSKLYDYGISNLLTVFLQNIYLNKL